MNLKLFKQDPKAPPGEADYKYCKRFWYLVKDTFDRMYPKQQKHFLQYKHFIDRYDNKEIVKFDEHFETSEECRQRWNNYTIDEWKKKMKELYGREY